MQTTDISSTIELQFPSSSLQFISKEEGRVQLRIKAPTGVSIYQQLIFFDAGTLASNPPTLSVTVVPKQKYIGGGERMRI